MTHRLTHSMTFAVFMMGLLGAPVCAQSAGDGGAADPHQQLREILKRPLYQRWQLRQEQTEQSAWGVAAREELQRFADWLRDWIESLFHRSSSSSGAWTMPSLGQGLKLLFWIVALAAIAMFVLALVVLLVRIFRDNQKLGASDSVLSREQVAIALDQGNALVMGGEQWMDEAGRLAAQKNFRAMYRALYLALLSGLHANGKIDFNRNYTNWTYVRRYRGLATEREVFSSLTDLFDSVWYGLQQSNRADLGTLQTQVRALIQPGSHGGDVRAN